MTSIGYTYNEDPIPEILCEKTGTLPNQKELDKLRSAANGSVDKLPCSHLFSTTVLQRIATVGIMDYFHIALYRKSRVLLVKNVGSSGKHGVASFKF